MPWAWVTPPGSPKRATVSRIAAGLEWRPMEPMSPIRGIYFDLWNTLAYTDHEPNPIVALASAFGLRDRADWRPIVERAIMTRRLAGIGSAIDALSRACGGDPVPPWTRRDLILLWGEACNRNRLYPDAIPALDRLSRYRLGILSNTQSFDLDFIRRESLAARVGTLCLSCDHGLLKPDPAFFRLACARMGLPAGQVLMIGDRREDDVLAAHEAGLASILLDRTGTGETGVPTIRSLLEIPRLTAAS